MDTDARASAPNLLVWAALWTVYIVWGSTYFAIRVMVGTLPPLLASGLRFTIAGAVLYAILRWRRGAAAMRISRTELVSCGIVGSALVMGGNGLVTLAERDVPSSLAALVIASVPLWVILMRLGTGDRISRATLLGVTSGFLGVAILVMPGERPAGVNAYGLGLLVAAAVLWALGSFVSTRLTMPKDPLVSTSFQMLLGSVTMLAIGFGMGEATEIDVDGFSGTSILAFGYLIVFGSLLAFTAYVWLLQNAPISKVATYAYVNPVIALGLGWLFLSERLTPTMLIGAVVIVASVAFTVRKETGSEPEEDLEGPAGDLQPVGARA